MKINFKDLPSIRAAHADRKIMLLAGTFDLLHAGHVNYLNKAKLLADGILVVGVNSDERTRRVKGSGRPIISQADRAELIANLKAVDYAFVMPRRTVQGLRPTFQVVRQLQPNLLIAPDAGWLQSLDYCKQHGTEVVIFKRIDITSTSRIIRRIKNLP